MNLVILSPLKPGYSETFINVHIHKLPFKTFNIHSLPKRGYFPLYDGLGNTLFSDNIIINYIEAGIDRLFNENGIGYTLRKKNLRKFLTDHNVKHVISEYGPTGTYILELLEEMNIDIYPYFHGRDAYHYKTLKRFGLKYRKLFTQSSKIFCVSKDMKKQLIKLGADETKIILNPCSPNTDIFYDKNIVRNTNQFISVGRFCGKKSPLSTIKSFEIALHKYPNLELLMIGDGPLFKLSSEYIKNNNLTKSIRLLGKQSPVKIAELLNESYAFIQHSVRADDGDSEGTPVAVMEAMICGCPIISTLHAGIPDVVIHKHHGFLVKEHDIIDMSNSIIKILELDDIQHMRQECVKRIKNQYNLENHIALIANAIH